MMAEYLFYRVVPPDSLLVWDKVVCTTTNRLQTLLLPIYHLDLLPRVVLLH